MKQRGSIPIIGIEQMSIDPGVASVEVRELATRRGLDQRRFDNLLLTRKSVAVPGEDPVTFAVNAAKPILDRMADSEKERIELLLVATESGIDFGKSISTYIHHYLGLGRNVRQMEIKHACYGGTGALQLAAGWIAGQASPGAKALVICTDVARTEAGSYAEPSQGNAGIAMLISANPKLIELDHGANGFYSHEIMDTFRPTPDQETGNPDLSLFNYIECYEKSFEDYARKVEDADYRTTFDLLACHTPFGGMVKGAHRTLLRKWFRTPPEEVEADYHQRLEPSLKYGSEVGNVYSGSLYLALAGALSSLSGSRPKRLGLFSYGSGCCSEFFSAVTASNARQEWAGSGLDERLARRLALTWEDYEDALAASRVTGFGMKDMSVNWETFAQRTGVFENRKPRLIWTGIQDYHREYQWSQEVESR